MAEASNSRATPSPHENMHSMPPNSHQDMSGGSMSPMSSMNRHHTISTDAGAGSTNSGPLGSNNLSSGTGVGSTDAFGANANTKQGTYDSVANYRMFSPGFLEMQQQQSISPLMMSNVWATSPPGAGHNAGFVFHHQQEHLVPPIGMFGNPNDAMLGYRQSIDSSSFLDPSDIELGATEEDLSESLRTLRRRSSVGLDFIGRPSSRKSSITGLYNPRLSRNSVGGEPTPDYLGSRRSSIRTDLLAAAMDVSDSAPQVMNFGSGESLAGLGLPSSPASGMMQSQQHHADVPLHTMQNLTLNTKPELIFQSEEPHKQYIGKKPVMMPVDSPSGDESMSGDESDKSKKRKKPDGSRAGGGAANLKRGRKQKKPEEEEYVDEEFRPDQFPVEEQEDADDLDLGEEDLDDKRRHWGTGRKKIKIEFIQNKLKRQITFSKRKSGMMKKIHELTTLTGTEALLVLVSETGHVYSYATPKLSAVVSDPENNVIKQSLSNWDAQQEEAKAANLEPKTRTHKKKHTG